MEKEYKKFVEYKKDKEKKGNRFKKNSKLQGKFEKKNRWVYNFTLNYIYDSIIHLLSLFNYSFMNA